jgi:serralysin
MTKFYNELGTANGATNQEDVLIVDYSTLSYPSGITLQQNNQSTITNRANSQTLLTFSSIDLFNVTGSKGNDVLIGGDYNRNAGFANNPYDDDQLYGYDGDDIIEGGGGDDVLVGGNGNDTLTGGAGMDELHGDLGNDKLYGGAGDWLDDTSGTNHFYANEAAKVTANTKTTLHADYSNYAGTGVQLGYFQGGGLIQNGMGGTLKFTGGLAFDIKGSQHNDVIGDSSILSNNDTIAGNGGDDVINGGGGNDFLSGDAGNDTLIGNTGLDKLYGGDGDDILNDTEGSLYGDAGFDTVVADYTNLSYSGKGIRFTPKGSTQLYLQSVENFNIKGTKLGDSVVGGIYHDTIDGGTGSDSIDGGDGDDHLFASESTYFDPKTIGAIPDSDIVNGGNGDDVIYSVTGIDNATKQLYGGAGADKFILNLRGNVTLGLDFNTTTLANFVNAITLPENTGPDWQQLGTDIAFETAGAVLGAIPVVGAGLSFLTSLAETGYGTYREVQELQAKISEQVLKANQAAQDYEQADWGSIEVAGIRDFVVINDFKIGIDSIQLPKLPTNALYFIEDASSDGLNGVSISIRPRAGSEGNSTEQIKNIAFVVNNYSSAIGEGPTFQLNDTKFAEVMNDLLERSQIGSFTRTSIVGDTNARAELLQGTFAKDVIYAMSGDDEVFGYFGDDVLLGDAGNDIIYGGSNQNSGHLKYERSTSNPAAPYLNDGDDYISGGAGDDILYGESGDDFINGDAFTKGINDTSVAVGNGNDKLYGGTGDDTLQGGAGSDVLAGGSGNDILTGDSGADYFLFDTALGASNIDQITDYVRADDTIRLENAIFTRLVTLGVLSASNLRMGAGVTTGADANDYIVYNTASGALYYDADGSGAGASLQIATLVGTPTLTSSDFVVV